MHNYTTDKYIYIQYVAHEVFRHIPLFTPIIKIVV